MEEPEVLREAELNDLREAELKDQREVELNDQEDSSYGGGENMSNTAATPRGLEEKQEEQAEEKQEDFYDCQETLEPLDRQREEEERRKGGQEERRKGVEQTQQKVGGDNMDINTDRAREEENPETEGSGGQEEQWDRLMEDEGMGSDVEVKEEESWAPEFDDDYLREVEKELTEEEKESRRQDSLALKEKGNSQFKAGEWSEAEHSYTEALVLSPVCYSRERAVLFSNRAAARLHLDLKDQAIADCSRAIELNPDYIRAILRRAELYEKTKKLDEALDDYKTVLDKDPGQQTAREACMRLPQQIHERNEKLKEEMMSKLKDLGNMFLRPFGLSTNNFQVNQDTDTGSYSVNFVQNPNNNNR